MGQLYGRWSPQKLGALVLSPRKVRDLVHKLRHDDPDMRQFVYLMLADWFLPPDIPPTLEAIAYVVQADSRLEIPFYTHNDIHALQSVLSHFSETLDAHMGDESWMALQEPLDRACDAIRVWWVMERERSQARGGGLPF